MALGLHVIIALPPPWQTWPSQLPEEDLRCLLSTCCHETVNRYRAVELHFALSSPLCVFPRWCTELDSWSGENYGERLGSAGRRRMVAVGDAFDHSSQQNGRARKQPRRVKQPRRERSRSRRGRASQQRRGRGGEGGCALAPRSSSQAKLGEVMDTTGTALIV